MFLFSMVLVVSFQLPFALVLITFVVMLSGCLSSLFSMFILLWVVIVVMSSSPVIAADMLHWTYLTYLMHLWFVNLLLFYKMASKSAGGECNILLAPQSSALQTILIAYLCISIFGYHRRRAL